MSFYDFRPYVSVAERRRKAEKAAAKLKKKGQSVSPVKIVGREIAKSFWGKSWCANLERYSDFASRLPRGRTYARNGSVVDLRIGKGQVDAIVAGTDVYRVKISVTPVAASRWRSICRDCAGGIDSLVELLQGRFARGVMDRVCREGDGLFPAPKEIKLSCSCPDWADMCKHVAAALYGVGARLDEEARLMFVLRGVDEGDLLAHAGNAPAIANAGERPTNALDDGDVAALFGLEMADKADPLTAAATSVERTRRAKIGTPKKQARPLPTQPENTDAAAEDPPKPALARTKPVLMTVTGKGGKYLVVPLSTVGKPGRIPKRRRKAKRRRPPTSRSGAA